MNAGATLNAALEVSGGNLAGQAGAELRQGSVGSSALHLAMAVPAGRSSKAGALIKDAMESPGNWKTVGSFVERAVNKKAKGGVSIQTIMENANGDRLVQHTVVTKAGKVIDDHFRAVFKP